MSYTITLSNGTTLPVVLDGVTDTTSTSITLIGKNYVGYGAFLNQNFAKLLENFSNATAPTAPLTGQIWWNSSQKTLNVFTGAGWKSIASSTVGTAAPTSPNVGDQWFDTAVGQLKVWNGTAWVIIGPAFTIGQGLSGAVPETIVDSLGTNHVVVRFYIAGVTVAILSKDATFTPATAILGFATGIKPGLNLSTAGSYLYYNDAYNSQNLGGVPAANYARTDIATTFNSTVAVSNNNGLMIGSSSGGDFSTAVTSSAVNLKSLTVGKALNLVAAGQANPSLSIASGTGLVTLSADPVNDLGAATKRYVDNALSSGIGNSTLILRRDGSTTITGTITPDANATREFGSSSLRFAKIYSAAASVAGQVELVGATSGIKFNDGTIQTTAATSPAAGSITPDRLSAGGPYWLGNGNLGVGTTNPATKLDVNGYIRSYGSGTANFTLDGGNVATTERSIHFSEAGTIAAVIASYPTVDGGRLRISNRKNADIIFESNAAERMRIDATGKVYISNGTVSGMTKSLNIYDATEASVLLSSNTAGSGNIGWRNQDTGLNWGSIIGFNNNGSNPYITFNNGGERMRITGVGRVGIGITAPLRELHYRGELSCTPTSNNAAYFNVHDDAGNNGGSMSLIIRGLQSGGATEVGLAGFNVLARANYFAGDVGIGRSAAGYKLDVAGTSRIDNGLVLAGGTGSAYIYVDTNTNNLVIRTGPSNAYKYTVIDAAGNLTAPGDVTAFSDVNLKKDIVTIENGLDKVLALRGVNFTRIDTDLLGTGLIAQEVEAVIPEVVHTDGNGIKSVAYGNLVGLLVEAIKELRAEVDELKKRK